MEIIVLEYTVSKEKQLNATIINKKNCPQRS